MKTVIVVILVIVALASLVSITINARTPTGVYSTIGPMLDTPVGIKQDFRVNCGTSATDLLVPMDGGTAGYPMPASAVYVAPTAGSTVLVRVGTTDVTTSTGFQIGTDARDGVGVSLDAKGPLRCISEGAAQQVDVIVGRQ